MPWTPKQHAFFQAIAHGMKSRKKSAPSKAEAKRMAGEGIAKIDHPHSEAHGPVPTAPVNEQAGGVTSKTFNPIMSHYGTIHGGGHKSNLKFYGNIAAHEPAVDKHIADAGHKVYYAGGKHGPPDLKNKNYQTKHLMVYDPTPKSGGDFGDEAYTRTWRKSHEMAHAETHPKINAIYGEGRRAGKLGTHRSPREAKRAVHWEWEAAHKQRANMAAAGHHISDTDFHKELNTVMGDAVHRAITGKFTEPDEHGFEPHGHKIPLEHALSAIDAHAKKIGLKHEDHVFRKSELAKAKTSKPGVGPSTDLKWQPGTTHSNEYGSRYTDHVSRRQWPQIREGSRFEEGAATDWGGVDRRTRPTYMITEYHAWGGHKNHDPRKKGVELQHNHSGETFGYGSAGHFPDVESAKKAALHLHVARHYGLKPHEVEAVKQAWPNEGVARLHGKHPDMVRADVARATAAFPPKDSMDKAEYKGKNFRTGKDQSQKGTGTKFADRAVSALKDVRANVSSGQIRNPDRAADEPADYARRASGGKAAAGPGDALFAVGAKQAPSKAGYHPRTVYSYGQHWPVVAHYPEHNLLVVNTHKYGGATDRIVKEVLKHAPKHFPGTNIVHVDHPDYQTTAHIMRGSLHGVHEHVKRMAEAHPDEERRKNATKHAGVMARVLGSEAKKSEDIRRGIALFKSLVDLEKAKADYHARPHPGKGRQNMAQVGEFSRDRLKGLVSNEVRAIRRDRHWRAGDSTRWATRARGLPNESATGYFHDPLAITTREARDGGAGPLGADLDSEHPHRVSHLPKPKLPGGHDRSHPDAVGTNTGGIPGDIEKARGKEKWRAEHRGTREQALGSNVQRKRAAFTLGERGENQAAVETEGKGRLNRYLHSIGLHGEYGKPGDPTREMGRRGPNVVDTTYSEKHGGPEGPHRQQLTHEVSHAQQVPVGLSVGQYQSGIGMPGDRAAARAAAMGTYEEAKAHSGEAGISRRSGLAPFKRPAVGGSGSTSRHAHEYARQNQRAIDTGINRFEPTTGTKVAPNTPDSRINVRAAGMPHEATRMLRERMAAHKAGQVKKSDEDYNKRNKLKAELSNAINVWDASWHRIAGFKHGTAHPRSVGGAQADVEHRKATEAVRVAHDALGEHDGSLLGNRGKGYESAGKAYSDSMHAANTSCPGCSWIKKSEATDFNSSANNQITRVLLAAGIPIRVHGEPKSMASLQSKIRAKRAGGRTYYGPSDVTDAYRGRISVLSNSLKDIDRAAKVVREHFEVDDSNSPDYANDPSAGYGRTHLVLRINGSPYELQIGTADAEEYGEPVHDSVYKNPKCDPALKQEHESIMGAIKGLNATGKSYHDDPAVSARVKALHGLVQKSEADGTVKDAKMRRDSAINRRMVDKANRGLDLEKAAPMKNTEEPESKAPKNSKEFNVKAKADQGTAKPKVTDGGEGQSIMDANVEGAMEAMGFGNVTGRLNPQAMALRHLAYKLKVHQNRKNKDEFTKKPLEDDEEDEKPTKKPEDSSKKSKKEPA